MGQRHWRLAAYAGDLFLTPTPTLELEGWSRCEEQRRRAAVALDLDPLAHGTHHLFEMGDALPERVSRGDDDDLKPD